MRRGAGTAGGSDRRWRSWPRSSRRGVRFVTVNADEAPGLVSRFGVSSTPTLFVLVNGERVTSMVGAQPVPILQALFEAAAARNGVGSGCACRSGCAPDTGWVSVDACTLPTAEQPKRLAEFDALFQSSLSGLRREEPGWLRLRLHGGDHVTDQVRDLTAREAECCSFFDFTVEHDGAEVVVDVRVPPDKIVVLDGLATQAEAARV
jgi:hypothetical protein